MTRFPTITHPGLGVGLDLPWGSKFGMVRDPVLGDGPSERVRAFLEKQHDMTHFFASWQPRNRNRLDPEEYFNALDTLFGLLPSDCVRALHQTTFNLGGAGTYDRGLVVDFTNRLIERYNLAWVNEDLGIWSLGGKQLPYPIPPYPTDAGLDTAIANTRFVQERLAAPLLVEFPGFSNNTTLFNGPWHAYDFFREVVEQSDSPATLDTGHLLSYQWLLGKRGEDLFDELERLPLASCFEIHLSGCQIVGERFIDAHHGILLDEQIEMLQRLLDRCPNVRAITYEDPRFDEKGALIPKAQPGFDRLKDCVGQWVPTDSIDVPNVTKRPVQLTLVPTEAHFADALHAQNTIDTDSETSLGNPITSAFHSLSERISQGLLTHTHAGCGSLRQRFPQTLAAWCLSNPDDEKLVHLSKVFSKSVAHRSHVELAAGGPGTCIEEAFYQFCCTHKIGDQTVLEEEFLSAMMRALATSPEPAFSIPSTIKRTQKDFIAVSSNGIVHAISKGRIIRGRLA